MTRVVVVADSSRAMAWLTTCLTRLGGIEIVRHASGRSPVGPLAIHYGASLVVIGDMLRHRLAVERVAEIRALAPQTPVVVLAADPAADWLAEALRAGAAAVVPGEVDVDTLRLVLDEAMASVSAPIATASTA